MTKLETHAEEIDEVERCRQVRGQLESEHPGFAAYFAWARAVDQELRRKKRANRKSQARAGRAVAGHKALAAPRKSAKSPGRS